MPPCLPPSIESEKGASLIEIMVAMTLISLALIGIVAFMTVNNALFSRNAVESKLTLVAQSMLDDIDMRYASGQNYAALASLTAVDWTALLADNGLRPQDASLLLTDISGLSDYVISATATPGQLDITGGRGAPVAGDIFMLDGYDISCIVQNAVDNGTYWRIIYGTSCPLQGLATNGAGLTFAAIRVQLTLTDATNRRITQTRNLLTGW